jgi:hypothetical protein
MKPALLAGHFETKHKPLEYLQRKHCDLSASKDRMTPFLEGNMEAVKTSCRDSLSTAEAGKLYAVLER